MSNKYQTTGIIKTYVIGTDHAVTQRSLVVQHNSVPVLWAIKHFSALRPPQIEIASDPQGVTTLAAVKPKTMRGHRVMLGSNPEGASKGAWEEIVPEGMTSSQHGFQLGGQRFWWRRTHDKAFGATSFSANNFKLVDAENRVLAVYISDNRITHIKEIGRIDFFVELGQELELFSLAAILGIQGSIRRQRRQEGMN